MSGITQGFGAFLPLASSALWQSMQMPAVAVGLWNAACSLVFIGGLTMVAWQSVQACCAAVAGWSIAAFPEAPLHPLF